MGEKQLGIASAEYELMEGAFIRYVSIMKSNTRNIVPKTNLT